MGFDSYTAMDEPLNKHSKDVILDSITDGVFTVDKSWRIVSFNKAASDITGVAPQEAIGRPCCDVFRASVCEKECALRQTMETGRPIVAKHIYIISAEGRRVPISLSTAVLRDGDGEIVGGVETFRDLSLVEELRRELEQKYTFADIIGRSPAMRRLFEVVPDIAESDSTILIEGASGTGKELFARAIHEVSARSKRRFVAINCGALPDTLLESELFGYKAGAFTDARRDKPGKFLVAEGGTILLDEIGDISPAMQSRLLRVLQERVIEPLGSVQPIKVDVRVIAATNQNLKELVEKGRFREDLYYRINVFSLQLPLLKERREDIPLLVEHFISKFNRRRNKNIAGVAEDAMRILLSHDYPGNVRELENLIEHAFILCHAWFIEPRHLPIGGAGTTDTQVSGGRPGNTLEDWEAIHILDAVRRHHGNRAAAARELGINPSTLFRKVKALGLELPAHDGRSRH
jgi:PAS domain S-box-containing protein